MRFSKKIRNSIYFNVFKFENSVRTESGIIHQKRQEAYYDIRLRGTASFAIKAGYWLLAALTLIFLGMLVLTVLHP